VHVTIPMNALQEPPNGDSFLCGWRLRSDLPMPELAPWTGDDREPDLQVRTGTVPARLQDALDVSPRLQVNAQKQARLSVDGVATYWLKTSHEVVVELQADAADPDVRTFLFGTILGLLCHRRGLFPLHASCVRIGANAIAIAGVSGAGKSTLAAALTRRGHALVCDDISVIEPDAAGGPVVRPAFPRVKLWQDSLDALGLRSDGRTPNRDGRNKHYLRFNETANFQTGPVPLQAIYLLDAPHAPDAVPGAIARLAPMQAVAGLHEQVYRRRTAARWGQEADLFKALGQIVGATAVYGLTRGADLAGLDGLVERLESHAGQ
jgi:hypothetical protein